MLWVLSEGRRNDRGKKREFSDFSAARFFEKNSALHSSPIPTLSLVLLSLPPSKMPLPMQQARAARLSVSALASPRGGGSGERAKTARAPAIPSASTAVALSSVASSASSSPSSTLPLPPSIDQWHEVGTGNGDEKDANYCGVEGEKRKQRGEAREFE